MLLGSLCCLSPAMARLIFLTLLLGWRWRPESDLAEPKGLSDWRRCRGGPGEEGIGFAVRGARSDALLCLQELGALGRICTSLSPLAHLCLGIKVDAP